MPDTWRNRNVLVTGCTGFLGSWLAVGLVDRGANVVGLARNQSPNSYLHRAGCIDKVAMVYGPVTDYGVVERTFNEYQVDTCFHLAAQSLVTTANGSPLATFESNVRGTWTVLEAARNCPTTRRLVLASSNKAYGAKTKLPYEETDALESLDPYGASKTMAEILTRTYGNSFRLPVAIARCSNIYGGGDFNYHRIIPGTIRSVLRDEPPILRSDGTAIRDYLYVLDAVEAYLRLASALDRADIAGQVFNFGASVPVTALDLVKKIIHLAGKEHVQPKILGKGKLPGEIHAQYVSSAKAKALLDWSPQYALEGGLSETIHWYRTFLANGAGAEQPVERRRET